MDLVFAISTISPQAAVNFAKIKEVIQDLIDRYGVQRVYYSIILFGRDPSVRIRFTQQLSEESLKNAVESLPRPSGGSSLQAALEKAREVFDEGSRPDSKKVLVVILDQKSESTTAGVKDAASKLEDDGIMVIPVAFGSRADTDEAEATTPNKANFVPINDTALPTECAEEISQRITDSEYENKLQTRMKIATS